MVSRFEGKDRCFVGLTEIFGLLHEFIEFNELERRFLRASYSTCLEINNYNPFR